jgi:hypothetical protein
MTEVMRERQKGDRQKDKRDIETDKREMERKTKGR